jgi:hypothetical protein
MNRAEVYSAIDTEREYQEKMIANPERPDMIEELGIGGTLLAMEDCLLKARNAWYHGNGNHPEAMTFVRKVCGLGVQIGEKLGMPNRE